MPSERKKMQKVKKSDEDASLFLIYWGGGVCSVSAVYDIIAHHALSVALFDNRLSHYWH